MAEQTALNARATAATVLAEELRLLKKYYEKERHSRRLLELKLNKLVTAKDDLMARHCHYGQKANK